MRAMLQTADFWKNEIYLYLHGVSIVHKCNPQNGAASNRGRIWRKKEKRLQLTAKVSKAVILKVSYIKMTGQFFAQFIRENFNITFAKAAPKGMHGDYLPCTMTLLKQSRQQKLHLKILKQRCRKFLLVLLAQIL